MGPFISAGALEFYLWENIAHYYELRYPSYTIVHYRTLSYTIKHFLTISYTIVHYRTFQKPHTFAKLLRNLAHLGRTLGCSLYGSVTHRFVP